MRVEKWAWPTFFTPPPQRTRHERPHRARPSARADRARFRYRPRRPRETEGRRSAALHRPSGGRRPRTLRKSQQAPAAPAGRLFARGLFAWPQVPPHRHRFRNQGVPSVTKEIVDAVKALEQEKGISADTLMDALEDALLSAYKKTPGAAKYARVDLDHETGDFRVFELILPPELEEKLLEQAIEEERTIDPETGEMREPE